MQIKLNLQIFMFALFFFITKQIEVYFVFMLFAFLHEMGHMLIGIALGFKLKKLEILPCRICSFY